MVWERTRIGIKEFEGGQQVLSIAMANECTTQQMQQGELMDTARYVERDRLVWVLGSSIQRRTFEVSGSLLTTPNGLELNYSSSHL